MGPPLFSVQPLLGGRDLPARPGLGLFPALSLGRGLLGGQRGRRPGLRRLPLGLLRVVDRRAQRPVEVVGAGLGSVAFGGDRRQLPRQTLAVGFGRVAGRPQQPQLFLPVGQRGFCRKPRRADLGELGGQPGRPAFQLVGPGGRGGRRHGRAVEFFGQVLAAVPFVGGLPFQPRHLELVLALPQP